MVSDLLISCPGESLRTSNRRPTEDKSYRMPAVASGGEGRVNFNTCDDSPARLSATPKVDHKRGDGGRRFAEYEGMQKRTVLPKVSRGVLVCVDGNYAGAIKGYDTREGVGVFQWRDGRKYAGQWMDNHPHGHGVYRIGECIVYCGAFDKGCFVGEALWRADGDNGTWRVCEGQWHPIVTNDVSGGQSGVKESPAVDFNALGEATNLTLVFKKYFAPDEALPLVEPIVSGGSPSLNAALVAQKEAVEAAYAGKQAHEADRLKTNRTEVLWERLESNLTTYHTTAASGPAGIRPPSIGIGRPRLLVGNSALLPGGTTKPSKPKDTAKAPAVTRNGGMGTVLEEWRLQRGSQRTASPQTFSAGNSSFDIPGAGRQFREEDGASTLEIASTKSELSSPAPQPSLRASLKSGTAVTIDKLGGGAEGVAEGGVASVEDPLKCFTVVASPAGHDFVVRLWDERCSGNSRAMRNWRLSVDECCNSRLLQQFQSVCEGNAVYKGGQVASHFPTNSGSAGPSFVARKKATKAGASSKAAGRVRTVWAFHGTLSSNVQSILANGFSSDMQKVCLYGKGTYFATDPKEAVSYCRGGHSLFVCQLYLGVKGRDYYVDNARGNYAVADTAHCLPAYLITFQ